MRKYVKLITFTFAAAALLLSFAVLNGIRAKQYGQQVYSSYMRSVNGLAESVCQVDIDLHKCICAGTKEEYAARAAQLWADTQSGKIYAAQLSQADGSLEGLERFLSQVGDYAVCIGQGESLTDEQYDRLIELSEYAGSLRITLEEFVAELSGRGDAAEEWQRLLSAAQQADVLSLSGMLESDKVLTDLPSLIYDGAFSDHVFERRPMLIELGDEVSLEQAKRIAEKVLGQKLYSMGASNGQMEEYVFSDADGMVETAVTKQEGVISYILRDVDIGQTMCTQDKAELAAQRFMRSLGYKDFVRVQYSTYGGMCVFSFAAQQDGIVLYPDQIKVGVALDCGDVVSFDARDYIMNHHERGVLTAHKTCSQAQRVVSDMLTITDSRLVLIPSDGLEERLCYEFFCRRWDGGDAAIYINADTLEEEAIYLLSRTEDGFMAV